MTSKIRTQAQTFLRVLHSMDIPAVVAGGCIRDDVLGLEAKDIDIFTGHLCYEDFCADVMRVAHNLLSRGHAVYVSIWDKEQGYEETRKVGLPYFLYIADFVVDGIQYQMISDYDNFGGGDTTDLLAAGKQLIERFDAGILQAFWQVDDDQTYSTVAFQHDVNCRHYTLTVESTEQASVDRFLRFNQRHPGLLRLNNPFARKEQ